MTDYHDSLVRQLESLGRLLDEDGALALASEKERSFIRDLAGKARKKLDALGDQSLTVGLMGGTGVGKSSIMNALAKATISSTSHRRPHTDDVILYRHEQAPLPPAIQETSLSWRDYRHRADEIRSIILCDLPDYDSIREEHRDTVMAFLDALDVIVWVLSPEKYADQLFYEFLDMLPKDRGNCYFILNKTDIFFSDGFNPEGQEELETALATLMGHLAKTGLEDPVVYHVSATDAASSRPDSAWNQFSQLRRELFRDRDLKEIEHIKAANIDAELEPAYRTLEREGRDLEHMAGVLKEWMELTDDETRRAGDDVEQAVLPWMDELVRDHFAAAIEPGDFLVGPGRIIAQLAGYFHGSNTNDPPGASKKRSKAVKNVVSAMKRHLSTRRDRVRSDLYRRLSLTNLPEEVDYSLEYDESLSNFEEGAQQLLNQKPGDLTGALQGGISMTIFRFYQRCIYAMLFIVFVLVLPGEYALRSFLETPGLSTAATIALLAVATLFSPKGLAAMASLVLLALFLGWRFYGHYRKLVERMEKQRKIELTGILRDAAAQALKDQVRRDESLLADVESKRMRLGKVLEDR